MTNGKRYSFRSGSRLGGEKAHVVGIELEKIESKYGGVSADHVLAVAEAAKHPLHSFFEWDTDRAAHQYRLEQARHLIRSVVVVYENVPKMIEPIRAFITLGLPETDAVGDDGDKRYLSMHTIMSDEDMRAQLLDQAMAEFHSWERRYQHLEALKGLFVEAVRVEQRREARRRRKPAKRAKRESQERVLEPA